VSVGRTLNPWARLPAAAHVLFSGIVVRWGRWIASPGAPTDPGGGTDAPLALHWH